ncbi:MAG: MFS transporter [Acidimicrobiales bacterium]
MARPPTNPTSGAQGAYNDGEGTLSAGIADHNLPPVTTSSPVEAPSTSPGTASKRRWIALVVLCVGQLMIILDATVVNVALPTIQRDLHFSQSDLAWVINAYLITFGGLLLLAGRIGDLIGPKKVFVTGLAAFTAASAICGLSHGQTELIVARFVQGAAAAVVAATILGLLVTLFPEPAEKAKAMGIYAFVASAGGAIGLLVGGAFTQALSWHWIFFINVPIGIVALVFSIPLIKEIPGAGIRQGVDVAGALLVTSAVMLLVYAIVTASTYGWSSPRIVGTGIGSVILAGAFVFVESNVRRPIVPLKIFRSRNISGATLVRMLFPVGMFGQFFVGALYLQHVLGYGAFKTGLAFLPMSLMITAFSLAVSPRLMTRIGAKLTLIPGLVLILAGLLLLSRVSVHGSFVTGVLPGMILFGAGAGLGFAPSVSLAMADSMPSDVGLVSGLANVSLQLGAAIGVAVIASISTSRTNDLLARGVNHAQALIDGYRIGYLIGAGCLLAAVVIATFVFRDVNVGRAPRLVPVVINVDSSADFDRSAGIDLGVATATEIDAPEPGLNDTGLDDPDLDDPTALGRLSLEPQG